MSTPSDTELDRQIEALLVALYVEARDDSNITTSNAMHFTNISLDIIEARAQIKQLIDTAYRSGYAAGNAKKNYRKKVDAAVVEQLKAEITEQVLATLQAQADKKEQG